MKNDDAAKLLSGFKGAFTISTAEGGVVEVAGEIERVCGYAADAFASGERSWYSLICDGEPEIRALRERLAASPGDSYLREYKVCGQDGRERWVWDQSWSEDGEPAPGEPRLIRSVILDIHERKIVEESILDEQRRFELALGAVEDGIWDWDVTTGEAYFSPRYYEMLGYRYGDFQADYRSWEALLHPDDLERAKSAVNAHFERGEPFDLEFRLRHKDGSWRWVRGRGRVMARDASGRVTRMVGTHVDIHKRRETEAKLEELLRSKAERAEALADERAAELAMLHTAVEQSPVSIVITDERGTIRYVNPFFCRLTGYAQDELVGANPRILKSGVHDAPFYRELWAALLSGRTWRGEICNRRKDGSLYWEEATISPVIGRDGAITNFIGVKEDASARREAARLRDELDAVLRHDLKNPLNVIINIPELLAAEPGMNDDQRESLGLIRDAGLLMQSVMNRSFIVHKIERGSYPYKPAVIDLGAAVMKATAFMRRLHADEGIAIEANVEPGPLFIKGDETLVDQMIVNLLDNALDSSVRGSSVSMQAYRRGESAVELAIGHKAALGKGAAATYLEKLSDQGSAAHAIGRYGARLMARLMGGDAVAAEERGRGDEPRTVVTVSLPSTGRSHGRA